jgi:tetratricopeptide (TPR) repeat protein
MNLDENISPGDPLRDLPPLLPLVPPRDADSPEPDPDPFVEVIAPTLVYLRTEDNAGASRPRQVLAILTADALWLQDTWQVRHIPRTSLESVERRRNGEELTLTFPPDSPDTSLSLIFANTTDGQEWYEELQKRPKQVSADFRTVPEGVALVTRPPDVPHEVLGNVEYSAPTRWIVDRGLQLRAAMLGADAVIWVFRQKFTRDGSADWLVSGTAIRVADPAARQRFRQCWYDTEVGRLIKSMLLMLAIQAAILLVFELVCAGGSSFSVPSADTPRETLTSTGFAFVMLYAWPLVILALVRILRWPQLLRAAGLAVLTVTTGRGLSVLVTHLLAVQTSGARLEGMTLWLMLDPVDWTFNILGVVFCVRAWRLASEAHFILPRELAIAWPTRAKWAWGLLALTAIYAVGLLGFAGYSRYQMSAYLLHPGVDTKREQEALLASKQGVEQLDRGDMAGADRSLQQSLRLWEELAANPASPANYRRNLARTLYNLGLVRQRQDRLNDAEAYYARVVTIGDELAEKPTTTEEFKKIVAAARSVLAELREGKLDKALKEKQETADRKYEEATIKAQKGNADAESLYLGALSMWQEILPEATNPDYKKHALARIAAVLLELGEFQQQLGKNPEAEASLNKAIEYGEQALALDPTRPLIKHHLELVHQFLDRQREQAHHEEFMKLWKAERYADAIDHYVRGIAEQEERSKSVKAREATTRILAYRLDQLAWHLAHCPDDRVQDTKAAVKYGRRATELQPDDADYWYTLAMVQYRNREWSNSLSTLEQVKTRAGEFGATEWLLIAMNRHQLKQRVEAREALHKAFEWIDERKRQAEDNAVLRFQYERMRPMIEGLRREAEKLIEGKGPGDQGTG